MSENYQFTPEFFSIERMTALTKQYKSGQPVIVRRGPERGQLWYGTGTLTARDAHDGGGAIHGMNGGSAVDLVVLRDLTGRHTLEMAPTDIRLPRLPKSHPQFRVEKLDV